MPITQTLLALAFLVDMWKKDLISIADYLIFSPNQFHLNRCFAQLPPSILDQINIKTKVIYLKQPNSINREQNKQLNFLDVSKPLMTWDKFSVKVVYWLWIEFCNWNLKIMQTFCSQIEGYRKHFVMDTNVNFWSFCSVHYICTQLPNVVRDQYTNLTGDQTFNWNHQRFDHDHTSSRSNFKETSLS